MTEKIEYKPRESAHFSIFKNGKNPESLGTLDVRELHRWITTGVCPRNVPVPLVIRNTDFLRKHYESHGKDAKYEADKLTLLPAVTSSGEFGYRANAKLIRHNGLINAEVDDGSDGVNIRDRLAELPGCVLTARSTARGAYALFAVFPIPRDKEEHNAAWEAVDTFVKDETGYETDTGNKGLSRLRFVAHDPDAFINLDAVPIVWSQNVREPRPSPATTEKKWDDAAIALPLPEMIERMQAAEWPGDLQLHEENPGVWRYICPVHGFDGGEHGTSGQIERHNGKTRVKCWGGCCGRKLRSTIEKTIGFSAPHGGSRVGAGRPSSAFDEVEAAEKIIGECGDRILQLNEGGVAVCGDNGMWTLLLKGSAHNETPLVTDLSQAAGQGHMSARNAQALAKTLATNFWREVKLAHKDDFISAAPVLGICQDSCIDLRTGEAGRWPDKRILDGGGRISIPYGMSEGTAEQEAMFAVWDEQYGQNLLRRLCSHLLEQSKSFDSVISPLADAGKGTMVSMLNKSMPGAVAHAFSTSLLAREDKFTPAAALLARYRLVFFDEVDKIKALNTSTLHTLCDDTLTIETKGMDPRVNVPRAGQGILLGANWAPVDASDQGVMARLNFFHRMPATEKMTREERLTLLSPLGIDALRAMILDTCRKLASGALAIPEGNTDHKRDFISLRTPEARQILIDGFGDEGGWVSSQSITSWLEERIESPTGKAKWAGKQVAELVQNTFPNARSAKSGGVRGYAGISENLNSIHTE